MKYLIYILPYIIFSQLNAQSYSLEQGRDDVQRSRNALTQSVPTHIRKYFNIDINEIDQMLKGEKTLNFKRAVYLVENAYYEGQIIWEEYNNGILSLNPILNKMIAPMHCYVKHRDEQGKWWNLEMTTGSFSRSNFMMETLNVSETTIKSGLFMKALSDVEYVAYYIYDLLAYYEYKTGRYSDDFIRKCYEIGLQYYPNSQLQINKANDLQFKLSNKMIEKGLKGYSDLVNYPELMSEFESMNATFISFRDWLFHNEKRRL